MNKISLILLSSAAVGFGALACENAPNVNTNRIANSAANAANTVANTASNAVNSVANTINKATTPSTEAFLKEVAQGGMAEVELGKLASQKAKSAEVKSFAQMMVADHSRLNTELKALAAKKNITLPTDLGSFQSTIDKLKSVTGTEFDKSYADGMVEDHEDDVEAFQKQADNAADPDVKAFAAKALPILKQHLAAIKAIKDKLNK